MAAMMQASTSGMQGARRAAARPFTAAKQLCVRSTQCRAGKYIEPEAAERAIVDVASIADIELELATADEKAYLQQLAADAQEAALDFAVQGGDVEDGMLAAIADEVEEGATDVDLEEAYGPSRMPEDRDPLSQFDNEDATAAAEVVRSLKLSQDELKNLVPADWDNTTVDWFTDKQKGDELPLPEFRLTFLWGDHNLLVGVDQVYARGTSAPLTEYFVWPRKDAWEELRLALEARPWISERDKILLLNRLTEVINYWMSLEAADQQPAASAPRPSLEEAVALFPDCSFSPGDSGAVQPPMPQQALAMDQMQQPVEGGFVAGAEPTPAM